MQVKSQLVPLQVAVPFAGCLHGIHAVGPQLAGSLSETQLPLQLCVPAGHDPSQALPAGMQLPLHKVVPLGHLAPHWVPSQVASPPMGIGQAVQPVPQLIGLSLRRQSPPHW